MPVVIYPHNVKTDKDKLFACYSLVRQMIDEHNKQVAIAETDKEAYTARLKRYIKYEFEPRITKVLTEQARLKNLIRIATYTPEEFRAISKLSPEDYHVVYEELYGKKEVERLKDTEATSASLTELKSINLNNLLGLEIPDPYEDFVNDYGEYDESSEITRATNKITVTDWNSRDVSGWVWRDMGSGHFSGDFEHLHEWAVTTSCGAATLWTPYMLNNIDGADIVDVTGASGDAIGIVVNYAARVYLRETTGGSIYNDTWETAPTLNTVYYCTIVRDDDGGVGNGLLTYYIRTGSHTGELIDTLSLSLQSQYDFQYVYGMGSHDLGSGASASYEVYGYSQNLDLQEVAGVTVTPSPASAIGQVVAPTVIGGSVSVTPDPASAIATVVAPTIPVVKPAMATSSCTEITNSSFKANGECLNTGFENLSKRGFEPVAKPTMSSSELDMKVCDGMVIYNGYLYLVGRVGISTHDVAKINVNNYSDVTYGDPADFEQGDGICVAGGYLWVGNFSGGIFKLSLSDLSKIGVVTFTAGDGIYALTTDGTYLYAGTGGGGYFVKYNISTEAKTEGEDYIGSGYYIHSLCYDDGYLYGTASKVGSDSIAFKVDVSDLSIVTTKTTTSCSHHDDIVQDDTYFYCVRAQGGISRFRKSDLDWTVLHFTDEGAPDGLDMVDGKLLLGLGQYFPSNTHQTLYVANQSGFSEHNRVALETTNVRAINEILVDGNYIHILQMTGAGSDGIYLSKWNKADILTSLIFSEEEGSFGTGTFNDTLENLDDGTLYYVRAFGKNSAGYGYGSVVPCLTAIVPSAASAIGSVVAPTTILGSLSLSPEYARAIAQVAQPGVILSSLSISPEYVKALASVIAPTVVKGSISLTPGYIVAIAQVIQPTVKLGDIIFSPAAIDAIAKGINPTVICGSITLTPSFVAAIGGRVNPVLILSSTTATPEYIKAIAAVIPPNVAGEAIYVTPDPVSAIAQVVAPVVVLGSVVITPDEAYAIGQVVAPNVIQGSIIISNGIAEAVGQVVAPTVIGGSITIEPESIEAIAKGENPEVILASMTVTPEFVRAIAGAVDPTVLETWIGRKLRIVIVTSQYRKIDAITTQYRNLKVTTSQKRKIKTITSGG